MKNYPSNSLTKEKPKKIVSGRVMRREKPILLRIFGENMNSVGGYIIWEVLIPAAKAAINDMVANGIEMLLYGDTARKSSSNRRIKRVGTGSIVSYNSIYDSEERNPRT